MIVAGFLFATMAVFVKLGAAHFDAAELAFYRSIVTLLMAHDSDAEFLESPVVKARDDAPDLGARLQDRYYLAWRSDQARRFGGDDEDARPDQDPYDQGGGVELPESALERSRWRGG